MHRSSCLSDCIISVLPSYRIALGCLNSCSVLSFLVLSRLPVCLRARRLTSAPPLPMSDAQPQSAVRRVVALKSPQTPESFGKLSSAAESDAKTSDAQQGTSGDRRTPRPTEAHLGRRQWSRLTTSTKIRRITIDLDARKPLQRRLPGAILLHGEWRKGQGTNRGSQKNGGIWVERKNRSDRKEKKRIETEMGLGRARNRGEKIDTAKGG